MLGCLLIINKYINIYFLFFLGNSKAEKDDKLSPPDFPDG